MSFKIKPSWPEKHAIESNMARKEYNAVYRELQNFYALVDKAAATGIGPVIHFIRKATFVEFGGPNLWNRRTELLIREIEQRNAEWFDEEMYLDLDTQWQLSGLDREEHLFSDVEIICSRCGR